MLIDRYDKNGKQLAIGDYILYKDKDSYKIIYNEKFLAVGIVDADSNFSFMTDWAKEDWEYKTYEELFEEVQDGNSEN